MGWPVVTVASGGMAVVDVTATTGRGTPVSEAANKFGRAVTKVTSGGVPVAYETIGIAPVLTYPTWSTAAPDKDTGIVLSNGNLTVGSTVGTAGGVRATAGGASGGKYYYEVAFVAGATGSNTGCGIIPAASSITNWAAAGTGGLINLNFSNGQIYYSGSSTGITLGSLFASHTICNAIDLVNNRFWARIDGGIWNGSGAADPVANVGGVDISSIFSGIAAYPAASMQAIVQPCSTANFGATSFMYPKPAGYSSFGV